MEGASVTVDQFAAGIGEADSRTKPLNDADHESASPEAVFAIFNSTVTFQNLIDRRGVATGPGCSCGQCKPAPVSTRPPSNVGTGTGLIEDCGQVTPGCINSPAQLLKAEPTSRDAARDRC